MSYSDYVKSQVKHHRCVICGRTFAAKFDEFINSYPVYHSYSGNKHALNCEDVFFKEVMRIYRYMHDANDYKTMRVILEEFPWSSRIHMQKEMLDWCMRQGYFQINNMKRLQVPASIADVCKELFAQADIEDPDSMGEAISMLKAALRCFNGDLEKPDERDLITTQYNFDRGETTLFDHIDTSNTELRSKREGMTSKSGAHEIDKRMHSASSTMERRRLEDNAP